MSLFKSSAALVLSLSLAANATAATKSNCVTEGESAAIFAAMMPDLIDGLRKKCDPHLPGGSYLGRNGADLVGRYKILADSRWPLAKTALGRMTGQPEMTDQLPDEFFRPMLGAMVGAEMVKDVQPQDCGGADRIVESLAPLPPENVAVLIGAILSLTGKEGDDSPFQVCKAS